MKVLQRRAAALRSKTIPFLTKTLKAQSTNERKTRRNQGIDVSNTSAKKLENAVREAVQKQSTTRSPPNSESTENKNHTPKKIKDDSQSKEKKQAVDSHSSVKKRGRPAKNKENPPQKQPLQKNVTSIEKSENVPRTEKISSNTRTTQRKAVKEVSTVKDTTKVDTPTSKIVEKKPKKQLQPRLKSNDKENVKDTNNKIKTNLLQNEPKIIEKNNNAIIETKETQESTLVEAAKKSSRKYQCGVCDKIFLGSNDLRKHLRIHSDERPYACPHCDKRFRQGGCLKNHVASQHGTDTVYTCDYCLKTFPIKERLRLHIRIHTGEKPYKCEHCPKTFARGGQLTQHLVTHTGLKKFKCDYCGQKFSSAANLRLHQKTHLDERDFTCHLCGKGFYRPDALKKHISCYHHNIKAFHCKICNKMFKGHLPQHKRTHKHIKKHGCSTCGATFSQRSQLVVHQRIHSGERPYRCQVCWQAFAHSSVLKLHIRKHTGEKPFKCPICVSTGLGFSQLPHLKKHLKSIHGQDKPYMCDNCKQFFKTKHEIQQHAYDCVKEEVIGSVEELIERTIRINQTSVDPPMPVARMRLLIAILLKKISSEDRLRQLGYEKRLIDNVLIDSLKCAGRDVCESTDITEAQRLKTNVQEFLEWTVPPQYMENFKRAHRSTEEILEELTN